MNREKGQIRDTIKSRLNVSFYVKRKSLRERTMDKKLFLQIMKQLQEVEDRGTFLEEELGVNTLVYDLKFYEIIDSLLQVAFNSKQFAVLSTYITSLRTGEGDSGTLMIREGKKEEVVPFSTLDEVWEVLQKFKDKH